MSLESVFKCPRTIKKLRSGPLRKLLDGFCDWLLERGFSTQSIRLHLANVCHLDEYFSRKNQAVRQTVSTEDIEDFFRLYPSLCRNRGPRDDHIRRVRHSIHRFLAYLRELGCCDLQACQEPYQPLLDAYLEWMHSYHHASDGTVEVRAHSLGQFLRWLGSEATPLGLSRLTPEKVEDFFLHYARSMGRSARRSMQSALRTFFRFCQQQGYVRQSLDWAIPTLRTYKLATVPRGLTDAQMQQTLRAINRNSDAGRRDYAILQMLYTYGVRGGQIRVLRLEDIDWPHNQICYKACKQGKDSRLPLTRAVGESLLDYLRNSRPPCSDPCVFLTCRAPFHPLPHSNALSAIVERHIRSAGINVPSKGTHAFRHGFATRMLGQGYSLKAIADVLGHRHLQTTFIYTKVDFNVLKQVPLEWPEEVKQ